MNQINYQTINIGFGNLADEYDRLQHTNNSVRIMRRKFYSTVQNFIPPPAYLLELNCGSGIDAHHLAEKGYNILATDISEKMLQNAKSKGEKAGLQFKKLNFMDLDKLQNEKFDGVISNLGGLNCIDNLHLLSDSVYSILKPGGFFICTVMPRLSIWELTLIFRGEFKRSLRRLSRNGTKANVGNEPVYVRYYSPSQLKIFFRKNFKMIYTKALRIFAPPPTADYWYSKHPVITSLLDKADNNIENFYPSSFICDNFISVFRKQ